MSQLRALENNKDTFIPKTNSDNECTSQFRPERCCLKTFLSHQLRGGTFVHSRVGEYKTRTPTITTGLVCHIQVKDPPFTSSNIVLAGAGFGKGFSLSANS